MTKIFCRYCGDFLYDDNGYHESSNYCKYKEPDCTTEARNCKAMLNRLLSSENEQIRNFAYEIQSRLDAGEYPKSQKPLLKYVAKMRSIDRLFTPIKRKSKIKPKAKPSKTIQLLKNWNKK